MKKVFLMLMMMSLFFSCGDDDGEDIAEEIIENCGGSLLTDRCWNAEDPDIINFVLEADGTFDNFFALGTWTCINNADSLEIEQFGNKLTLVIKSIDETEMIADIAGFGTPRRVTFKTTGTLQCD